MQISDLHLGSFNSTEKLEEVVDLINNENADLVVFTGDLVNNFHNEALPYVKTLSKIQSKYGNFSVLGNHDYCDYVGWKRNSKKWKENFSKMLQLHKDIGFDLLLNESREILIDNQKFNLVGVENWGAGNFNKDGDLDHIDIGPSAPLTSNEYISIYCIGYTLSRVTLNIMPQKV